MGLLITFALDKADQQLINQLVGLLQSNLTQGAQLMATMADLDAELATAKTALDALVAAIKAIPPAVVDTSPEVAAVVAMVDEMTGAMPTPPAPGV